MNKKLIVIVIVIVILPLAWYLVSPIWRVKTANEPSPLDSMKVEDNFETMDEATRSQFEKETQMKMTEIMIMEDEMPKAQIAASGDFKPRAHDVAGNALLIQEGDKKIVRFENFNTINGPDLHIYLSSDLGVKDYIDLGKIKATQGNVNYDVPAGTDTNKYKYVLVWC